MRALRARNALKTGGGIPPPQDGGDVPVISQLLLTGLEVQSCWVQKVTLALGKGLAADLAELFVRSLANPRILLTLVSHSSHW